MDLSYERLTRISLTHTPYRGSTNRFPLLTRRQNRKYFLVREEDGKKVFDIAYGQSWHSEKITKEQADALSRTSKKSLVERAGGEYLMYVTRPRIVGTVYPGETPAGEFEFNSGSYGQGDRMFLSGMFRGGWFTTNSRKGGMLYRKRMDGKSITHPIYRGMRVDAMTMRPIKPYEVVVNQVDRKKSKAVMAKYAHFFKVSEVMLKSINVGQVIEIANHLLYEGDHPMSKRFAAGALRRDTVAMCLARGEELINDAPLDAFVWFALGHEIGRILYRALGRMVGTRADDEYSAYDELFMSVKRRLVKDTYMRNPEVFKEVSYEMGADIPASDWGMKIIVDGKEVEQYA